MSTQETSDAQQDSFDDSPQGRASRWGVEFAAARKEVERWHKQGEKIVKRFRDDRGERERGTRWNLFSSSVQTQAAMLYGQTPRVDVSRRFADPKDDVARVAAEMLERLLNTDIEDDADSYTLALQFALQDWRLPGLGNVRLRYVAEYGQSEAREAITDDEGNELAPAVEAAEEVTNEDVETEYVYWRDQLWSPCRTYHELRWWAFRSEMSRSDLVERFGEIGKLVPLGAKRNKGRYDSADSARSDPWSRAEVWEIWDKEAREVVWFVDGFGRTLDAKRDTLGLAGFWPFPRPMIANSTTSTMVPVPDFVLAQDLYNEIDEVSTRITTLEKAIRVAGVYDANSKEIQRLLSETSDRNELIPVAGWGAFSEKGGLVGAVAWLPLEQIVMALDKLREYRAELQQALWQITGMGDIMRGQATTAGKTATEAGIQAGFGSVRITAAKDEFARFAGDVQRLKAEIIAKHFRPETIVQRSNVMLTGDAPLAQQAAELIKSKGGLWRVEVKADSVSMADLAGQRSEAGEFVQGLSTFLTAAQPLAATVPGAAPFLLELLGLVMTRFKFADQAEGILDRAIAAAQQSGQQASAPPPPDPKIQAAQIKAQADQQRLAQEQAFQLQKLQAETIQQDEQQRSQALWNVREEAAKTHLKVQAAHAMPRPALRGPA
jgi:hypothetical protein